MCARYAIWHETRSLNVVECMDHLLKACAQHCGLSLSQYWHLRLLLSISFVPLLVCLYAVLIERRWRRIKASPSLWIDSQGRLRALPEV